MRAVDEWMDGLWPELKRELEGGSGDVADGGKCATAQGDEGGVAPSAPAEGGAGVEDAASVHWVCPPGTIPQGVPAVPAVAVEVSRHTGPAPVWPSAEDLAFRDEEGKYSAEKPFFARVAGETKRRRGCSWGREDGVGRTVGAPPLAMVWWLGLEKRLRCGSSNSDENHL